MVEGKFKDLDRPARMFILDYIKKGDICAEIGVWSGKFSQHMLAKNPSKLHLIDPWKYMAKWKNRCYGKRKGNDQDLLDSVYQQAQDRFKGDERVYFHRMSSVKASKLFPNEYFDFIYIDGNHNFEYVLADLVSFIPKMKAGSIISGDDYHYPRCRLNGAGTAVGILIKNKIITLDLKKNNQWIIKINDPIPDVISLLPDKAKEHIKHLIPEAKVDSSD